MSVWGEGECVHAMVIQVDVRIRASVSIAGMHSLSRCEHKRHEGTCEGVVCKNPCILCVYTVALCKAHLST